jgi:hypothetical protein
MEPPEFSPLDTRDMEVPESELSPVALLLSKAATAAFMGKDVDEVKLGGLMLLLCLLLASPVDLLLGNGVTRDDTGEVGNGDAGKGDISPSSVIKS